MKRSIKQLILLLVLIALFACGCHYAYTRDLYRGNNKIYVQPDESTGEIAVTADIVQTFVPGHDFDGVSLLLDHNLLADLGTMHVSVYRTTDDQLVMERLLPVAVISAERYTFIASEETIAAEADEAFYAVIEYDGPASGTVTVATGDMPSEVVGACDIDGIDTGATLAIGIVTDYQYEVRNCWLIIIASAVFVITVGLLTYNWNKVRHACIGCRKRKGDAALDERAECERGRHVAGKQGKVVFLLSYLGIITSLFLLSLTMTASAEYMPINLGAERTGTVSLSDGESIDAYIVLPAENICEIQIPVIRPLYNYTDETLSIQVLSTSSGQLLQTYETTINDIGYYGDEYIHLLLDDRYDAGTCLRFHITTEGMSYGEPLQFMTASIADTDNQLYVTDVMQNSQLCAVMYVSAMVSDYNREILLYVEAIIIGLVLAWLLFCKNYPLYIRKECADIVQSSVIDHPADNKRTIMWLVVTLLCGIVIIDYSWVHGVGYVQDKIDAEIVSYTNDYDHNWVQIPMQQEITQTFTVDNRHFCGLGIMIADSGLEHTDDVTDAVIHVTITDHQDTIICDSEYQIGDLSHIGNYLAKDSNDGISTRGEMFYYIPLNDDMVVSEGTELTLHIRADANDKNVVMIAVNDRGRIHLMTAYHRYAILVPQFVLSMGGLLVAACLLSVIASKRRYSSMVSFVILATMGGIGLSLAIPTMSIADGMAHVKYLYLMSNQLSGVYDVSGPGKFNIATTDISFFDNGADRISLRYYANVLEGLFKIPGQNGCYTAISSRNLQSLATIWTYLPSLLGFYTAQSIGFTATTAAVIGKWCSLAAALALTCYAIHKTPVGKCGWMVIALFPGLMQYTASISYDGMINAITFLYVGNVLHLIYEEDRSGIDYLVTMISAMLLLWNKSAIYLPIVCIVFIPVIRRLLRWNKAILFTGSGVAGIAIVAIGLQHADRITSYADAYTIADLIHDPMNFIHLVENTFVMRGDYIFSHVVGSGLNSREAMEPKYVVAGICILLYLAWRGEPENTLRVGRKTALYIGCMAGANVLLLCMAWYLTETTRLDVMIHSLSGKYLEPIVILSNVVGVSILSHRQVISQQRIIHIMSLIYMICVGLIYMYVFYV